MSATPQRETYPLVSSDDTLMMVFRDHITTNARPVLYVKALTDAQIRVDAAQDLDAKPGVRVVDYSVGTGDILSAIVNGVPTVLTEGVDFNAATSNLVTATNISLAITAIGGLTATTVENVVYVESDNTVNSLVLGTGDPLAWDTFGFAENGTPQTLTRGQTVSITLPTGAFYPLNKVSILNVLSGKVSADLRSFNPVRTYFRMPYSLRATTGHPGGWPTSSS